MKQCRKCLLPLPLDDFARHKDSKDGRRWICKLCEKKYRDVWRAENKEKQTESRNRWKENNRLRYNDLAAQYRARKKLATVVDLTVEQIELRISYYGYKCWVCRIEEYEEIDHVKPLNKGGAHMLCNLRPICKSCNRSKSDKWPYERNNFERT